MYYYSKRSRSKIVHQSTCQHIQNVSVEDVGSFENLEDAYAAGYRLCRHCSPIAKLYRKESDVLQGYCQSHAASVFFKDRFIGIWQTGALIIMKSTRPFITKIRPTRSI